MITSLARLSNITQVSAIILILLPVLTHYDEISNRISDSNKTYQPWK